MIEDFTIEDGIYLVSGEDTLDLHNNFDFSEVTYSPTARRVTMTWFRSSGEWAQKAGPVEVQLQFHGVSDFRKYWQREADELGATINEDELQ